jgi:hypothetical protein
VFVHQFPHVHTGTACARMVSTLVGPK